MGEAPVMAEVVGAPEVEAGGPPDGLDIAGGIEAGDVEAVPVGDVADDGSDERGHGEGLGAEVVLSDVGVGPSAAVGR